MKSLSTRDLLENVMKDPYAKKTFLGGFPERYASSYNNLSFFKNCQYRQADRQEGRSLVSNLCPEE